jgi:hypothetical protein
VAAWDYDEAFDCADIHIIPRDEIPPEVRTIDLEGIHVLIDVDLQGNILTIELLGDISRENPRRTILRDLGKYLKEKPSGPDHS